MIIHSLIERSVSLLDYIAEREETSSDNHRMSEIGQELPTLGAIKHDWLNITIVKIVKARQNKGGETGLNECLNP